MSWGERWRAVGRLLRYRLLVPIMRGRHDPEYTARGSLVGVLIAMSPLVGIQMAIVGVIWAAVRWVAPRWGFNLVVALAWTWITNVFTLPPIYYVFLLTGRLIMGRFDEPMGFGEFSRLLTEIVTRDESFFEAAWLATVDVVNTWGWPMMVGCVPWAIACSIPAYYWSLSVIRRFSMRRKTGTAEAMLPR
jgi:uncharacterized protein